MSALRTTTGTRNLAAPPPETKRNDVEGTAASPTARGRTEDLPVGELLRAPRVQATRGEGTKTKHGVSFGEGMWRWGSVETND